MADLHVLIFFRQFYCRCCSHLRQRPHSNWLFCWFYPPQLCRVYCWRSHGQSGSGNFTGFLLFSATCAGWCWYHGMYFSINPCSSSDRTWTYLQTLSWSSRYFVGERPSHPYMMWWMVSFSTQQIQYVSSSSTLKKCFSIYLVEIACSWMAATVDSVAALFRVEGFSLILGWSRYFANCPCIFFLLSSASSLWMRADLTVNFRGNFFIGASCWISWPISSQYRCGFWWIDFSSWVTSQFNVSFNNCSSEFKR